MKILVAISSCQAFEDQGLNDPLRNTWLKDLPERWDYKFFHGRGALPKDDVVLVDCDDAYFDLTSKTKLKIKWALDNGYDWVYMCFPDTYASAVRLQESGFNQYDYYGSFYCHPGGTPYCHGGPGYFLSRKAMEILNSVDTNYPNEDCWVGDNLYGKVTSGDNPGFAYCGPGPQKDNKHISNHLSTQPGGYVGTNHYSEHALWLKGQEK